MHSREESAKQLGYKLTKTGISLVFRKSQGISDRLRPTILKQLRSFLGAANQFKNFIPSPATIQDPLNQF